MKKLFLILCVFCILLTGCARTNQYEEEATTDVVVKSIDSPAEQPERSEPQVVPKDPVDFGKNDDSAPKEEPSEPEPEPQKEPEGEPPEEDEPEKEEGLKPEPPHPMPFATENDYDPPEHPGTPVTFTVQKGKTNFIKNSREEYSQDSRGNPFQCIDSLEELNKRFVDADIRFYDTSGESKAPGGLAFEDVNPYDEAFFKEYSLMPVYLVFGSGGNGTEISDITKENGKLTVWLEISDWQGMTTCAIEEQLYCIEVPKEEIADCTAFELNTYTYKVWEK